MSILAKRLKEARDMAGYKQIEAAEKLGISNGTLSGYERDYRDPDTGMLHKMANLYGVSVDWLLGKVDHPNVIYETTEDDEFEAFIKDVRRWYKEAPKDKEEDLKRLRRIFEAYKNDE